METIQGQRQLLIQERTVTDPKEIARYDRESGLKWYIHKDDISTVDKVLIQDQSYTESKKNIGELSSIYVAVCDDDPFKDSQVSPYRIHFRLGDGLHRFLQTENSKVKWTHRYVRVKDFEEFIFLWSQFGSNKSPETIREQKRVKVMEFCNYVYDIIGITPKTKVAAYVMKKLGNKHPYGNTVLNELIPEEFKDMSKNRYQIKKDSEIPKKKSKKDILIEKLNNQIDSHLKTINEMKMRIKPPDEKDLVIKDLDAKYANSVRKILRLENEVKLLRAEVKRLKT